MSEEDASNYVYGVMAPQKDHQSGVSNCCKYGKGCPPWPSNTEELQNIHHATPEMARVKEVRGVSVRNS